MTIHSKISQAIWLVVFCNAMCFFGYVYEAIVDLPNLLFAIDPNELRLMWAAYHCISNPAYYYGLITIISIVGLVYIWVLRKGLSQLQVRNLKRATYATVFANVLTIIAVTQINNQLFFGAPISDPNLIRGLAKIWSIINFARLSFVLLSVISLLRIFHFSLNKN